MISSVPTVDSGRKVCSNNMKNKRKEEEEKSSSSSSSCFIEESKLTNSSSSNDTIDTIEDDNNTNKTKQQKRNEKQEKRTNKNKQNKLYTKDELSCFNLLERPVWIFDIQNKCMWWANISAIELWNATSLEELLERDFASDMSQTVSDRINSYLERFKNGERFTERCTFYPKGIPTTVDCVLSGIHTIDGLLMLNEGDAQQLTKSKQEIEQINTRRIELLRYLPLAVTQFDSNGCVMEQNPESMNTFRGSNSSGPTFIERFVDKERGENALQTILNMGKSKQKDRDNSNNNSKSKNNSSSNDEFEEDDTFHQEELLQTTRGPRWFAVKGRKSKDPVTGETVVLFSARDTTEIRKARQQADQAMMERTEFLAVMAHEIRTPLHQVIGFIELLGKTQLSSTQHDYVCFLTSSAKCLMTIINDLLDYTKLEASKMKIECIPFETSDVISGSIAAIQPKAEEKGLSLKLQSSNDVPAMVKGDPTRLRQLLLNLLHNAVKFTDKGGEISLHVQRKQIMNNNNKTKYDDATSSKEEAGDDKSSSSSSSSLLRFEVRDTGMGISPKNVKCIFSKYRQADETISRNYGGTGLGLAICKRLVELMDGSIGVSSELGKGSTFWFELPYKEMEGLSDREEEEEDDDVDEAADTIIATTTKRSIRPTSKTDNNKQQSLGLNVLVAEDNLVNRKLATALLKQLGHSPTTVENGLLAVQALERSSFDLVLMDVQMPVMDGFEATKKIREVWAPSRLPVVGLTADFVTAELDKYKQAGMNDCLGKPIRLKNLNACMNNAMKGIVTQ